MKEGWDTKLDDAKAGYKIPLVSSIPDEMQISMKIFVYMSSIMYIFAVETAEKTLHYRRPDGLYN